MDHLPAETFSNDHIEHFDAIVIGSGFGGSVMAYRLAEAQKSVCLLERGDAYAPGDFARTPFEMRNNFWDPSAAHHGLFDVWSFGSAEAVVSSGLGGGSLIYANVLIRKDRHWFVKGPNGDEHWPIDYADLEPHFDAVEARLRPQVYPDEYQRDNKTSAMRAAAVARGIKCTTWDNVDGRIPQWYLPRLAVTFRKGNDPPTPGVVFDCGNNYHGKPRETCRLCGECDVGCNYGAKDTLDFNYISDAKRLRASVRPLCEAKSIVPLREGGYRVSYVKHIKGTSFPTRHEISAKRVIVSCGTFGTTLFLLKNKPNLPLLSAKLGHHFSGNGDFLAFAIKATSTLWDKKREPTRFNSSRAPVITSTFRFPDEADGGPPGARGHYVQDAGYPLAGDYIWELLNPASDFRRVVRFVSRFVRGLASGHRNTSLAGELEALLGRGNLSSTTMPMLGMGRDIPNGRMSLNDGGRLDLVWPSNPSRPFYRSLDRDAREIVRKAGARYDINPLTLLFNRLITVHPLGGCRMAETIDGGVVNSSGEVFNYPGLYVADGSVMPGSVGANPSLTIAAVADYFATRMLANWR
jgi:cholesterol oxidase